MVKGLGVHGSSIVRKSRMVKSDTGLAPGIKSWVLDELLPNSFLQVWHLG